jgi:hypothetical protein
VRRRLAVSVGLARPAPCSIDAGSVPGYLTSKGAMTPVTSRWPRRLDCPSLMASCTGLFAAQAAQPSRLSTLQDSSEGNGSA